MSVRQSLFEPSGGNALGESANWIADTVLGSVATGRLEWRQGMRVIGGCFITFGAPVVAVPPQAQDLGPREELPRSDYNPYGGASLRDDREPI